MRDFVLCSKDVELRVFVIRLIICVQCVQSQSMHIGISITKCKGSDCNQIM